MTIILSHYPNSSTTECRKMNVSERTKSYIIKEYISGTGFLFFLYWKWQFSVFEKRGCDHWAAELLRYAFLLWADVPAVPIAVSKNISSCLLRICPSGKDPITLQCRSRWHRRWCQFGAKIDISATYQEANSRPLLFPHHLWEIRVVEIHAIWWLVYRKGTKIFNSSIIAIIQWQSA